MTYENVVALAGEGSLFSIGAASLISTIKVVAHAVISRRKKKLIFGIMTKDLGDHFHDFINLEQILGRAIKSIEHLGDKVSVATLALVTWVPIFRAI